MSLEKKAVPGNPLLLFFKDFKERMHCVLVMMNAVSQLLQHVHARCNAVDLVFNVYDPKAVNKNESGIANPKFRP